MSKTPSYSIIIDIPEKTDLVFLIVPFSAEFDMLGQSIAKAVAESGFRLSRRTDFLPITTWHEQLFLNVRCARVVIAVCSPETLSNRPNLNVMYELGLAHALGKPTIIVTSERESLPSDLRRYQSILYDKQDSTTFIFDLQNSIREMVQASKDGIIDGSYTRYTSGISVSSAPHFAIFRADLWDSFVSILSAGLDIHNHFEYVQALLDNILHDLKFNLLTEQLISVERWDLYVLVDRPKDNNVFDSLQQMLISLNTLQSGVDLKTHAVVSTSKRIYSDIRANLDQYVELREQITNELKMHNLSKEKSPDIYTHVRTLYTYAMNIRRDVGSLNSNTIRIITE